MGLDIYVYCNDRALTREVQPDKFYAHRGIILYWRNAYMIPWWVIHHAEMGGGVLGKMEVGDEIEFTIHDLKRLKSACDAVLEDPGLAKKLLPIPTDRQSANKFSSISTDKDYDDHYFTVLKDTSNAIGKILDLIKPAEEIEGDHTVIEDYTYEHSDWFIRFTYCAS